MLGLLAFLAYGSLFSMILLSFPRLRQWSADHVVQDSLAVIPLTFFPLLLIPTLPWWGAALISLTAFTILMPFAVRRSRSSRPPTPASR